MSATLMLESQHPITGLAPVADAGNGTVYTDIVRASNAHNVLFTMLKGVGTTGNSTITVEACDDVSASNVTAIPFWYSEVTTNDVAAAVTRATTSGFATSQGSATIVQVEVDAGDIASTGYEFVRMKMVEVTDSPVLFGVLVQLCNLRESRKVGDTYIA